MLHLKEDAIEYVEQDKIKELVRRYSQFINYPIYLWVTKDVTKQIDDADYDDDVDNVVDKEESEEDVEKELEEVEKEEKAKKEDVEVTEEPDDDEQEEEEKEKQPEEPKKKTITETIWTWELVNDAKAIWL